MEKYAVIVAGGSGLRMGNAIPKQFLLLNGKPVLWHTIQAFRQTFSDVHIVLVIANNHHHNEQLQSLLQAENITIVEGGETRFHSVKSGLMKVPDDTIVFVHDGVRCLVSTKLIRRCYEQTIAMGNAVPVVAATDSLRIEKDGSHTVIDRQYIKLIQTPQTFLSTELKAAFKQRYSAMFTDEATVMEAFGKPVYLIEGEYENLKITRPLDLVIAEKIIEQRLSF